MSADMLATSPMRGQHATDTARHCAYHGIKSACDRFAHSLGCQSMSSASGRKQPSARVGQGVTAQGRSCGLCAVLSP